jgi:hypothetical protein
MAVYDQVSVVRSRVTFLDDETDEAVDPDTVTFSYQLTGQSPTTPITYSGATTPSVGVVAKVGTGRYETWIDTTSILGDVIELWTGTGAHQAPGTRIFTVKIRGT